MSEANITTPDVLEQWPTWRNSLIVHLTRQGYTGDQVGDVLKEIQSYVDESGETPEQAFGDPKTYARQRTVAPKGHRIGWREPRTLIQFAGIFVAGSLMVGGSILIMLGRTFPFDIPPTSGIVAGSIMLIIISLAGPRGGIRDPQTGKSMMKNNELTIRRLLSILIVFIIFILFATLMRNIT